MSKNFDAKNFQFHQQKGISNMSDNHCKPVTSNSFQQQQNSPITSKMGELQLFCIHPVLQLSFLFVLVE